jgi:hypothetical protein
MNVHPKDLRVIEEIQSLLQFRFPVDSGVVAIVPGRMVKRG